MKIITEMWHKAWPDEGAFVRVSAQDLQRFAALVRSDERREQPAPANLWLYWKVDGKSVVTGPFKTHSKDEAHGLDCIDQTPLTVPAPQQQELVIENWMKPHPKCDAACLYQCTKGFQTFPECAAAPQPAQQETINGRTVKVDWKAEALELRELVRLGGIKIAALEAALAEQPAPVHPDSVRIDWLTNNPVDALDIFGRVKGADAVRWIRQEIDNAIKENT
jgi:hypothetical protein